MSLQELTFAQNFHYRRDDCQGPKTPSYATANALQIKSHKSTSVQRCTREAFSPLDLGNILLDLLIIIAFNNKLLLNYQIDLRNLKHIIIQALLVILFFVFSTFFSPIAMNFKCCPPLKYFDASEKFLQTPMHRSIYDLLPFKSNTLLLYFLSLHTCTFRQLYKTHM